MRRLFVGALVVLLLAPTVRAQETKDDASKQQKLAPPQQLKELLSEYQAAMDEFKTKYRSAKTSDERQALLSDSYPKPSTYAPKVLQLVKQCQDDPIFVEGLTWLLNHSRDTLEKADAAKLAVDWALKDLKSPDAVKMLIAVATRTRGPIADQAGEKLVDAVDALGNEQFQLLANLLATRGLSAAVMSKLTRILIEKYADNEAMKTVCMRIAMTGSAEGQETLRKLIDKTTSDVVKGHAMFALAYSLLGRPVTPNKEAEELLAKIIADYADIESFRGKTLGTLAAGPLFEMQHLQIGMVAPNIEGEDVDGKRFQLADYKGKVVVLDFWGDW